MKRIPETVKDWEEKERVQWVVPAAFYAMQYINHGQNLPEDATPKQKPVGQVQSNSVQLFQTWSPDRVS